MGILDEDVVRVRESTDIVALIGEHLALKKVGTRYRGLCPFHQEKTPSFYVNAEMGLYKCFGCGASGDAITFVRELEHLDFGDAVERLAAKSGVTLRYDDKRTGESKSRNAKLAEAVGAAIDEYHRLLLESPEAGAARRYLRSRGFDGDAARRFKIGWAPDEWDQLSRALQQRGHKRDDLVGAGLAFVNRANRLQDQFRARLMFPIYDARGEPAGFGGRALGDQMPKYKNSPDNPLYHKSRILYGLNWAKAEIVARGEVIVCEGYTDVMAFALAGAPNAVATCGTALTDDHVRALKNLARRVVLAYDADAAGQGAAEKWFAWEAQYDIELRVAALPSGGDPAEVWQESPEALIRAVDDATPFLQFRLDRLFAASDLTTAEGRGRAGQAAAAIVSQHPNELVRDQYVMQLAARLQIEADALRHAVAQAVARPVVRPGGRETPRRRQEEEVPPSDEDAPRHPAPVPIDRRELDLLRWAIHEPEIVADWIEAPLFADPQARAVFELLMRSHTFHDALDASDGTTRALLERLAVEEPIADGEPETIADRLLLNSVEPRGRELLQAMLTTGDDRASDVKRLLDEVAHDREMGDWARGRDAARRLLAWVAHPATAPPDAAPTGS
ncbi:MAG: DNA primase [Actinomycetota bacterium]